jgi:hypothetical protein
MTIEQRRPRGARDRCPGTKPRLVRACPGLFGEVVGRWIAACGFVLGGGAACLTVSAGSFVLDLPGEGVLPGEFVAMADDGPQTRLRWQSPVFSVPFEFALGEVVGVRSLGPEPPQEPGPDPESTVFRVRLEGGDSVDGEIVAIESDQVTFRPVDNQQPVRIQRSLLTGIVRRAAGETGGYVGPAGLNGWNQEPASSWRDEAGRIATDRPNASVSRDVGGPARARYDITLSWQKRPELVFAVAAGAGDGPDAYRFEMLTLEDGRAVAIIVRQDKGRGDIAEVVIADPEPGRLRLSLFVDQEAGRLAAFLADGRDVVDLTLPPAAAAEPGSRVRLTVRAGDVCLESLRVSQWTGLEPLSGGAAVSQLIPRTGPALEGEIESLDASGQLVVATATGPKTMPLAEVQELRLPHGTDSAEAATAGPPPSVRLVRWGGSVISGEIMAVTDTAVRIGRAGIEGTVLVPLNDLRSLASLRAGEHPELPGRAGHLIMEGVKLPGCLAGGGPTTTGLAWQPQGSSTASGFAPSKQRDLSAVVEYVPPEVSRDESLAGLVDVGGIGGAVNQDENGSFVITMLAEEGAAARDGRIEPGDQILAVRPLATAGFVETRGLDLETVMNLLRGRVGTPVSVRIQPASGAEPVQIDLVRGLIYVASQDVLDQALAAHARLAAGQAAAIGDAAGFPGLVILRSGDVVAAALEGIGSEGVRVRSPVTASEGREPVVVAHSLVQAVELDPSAASRPLDRAQWQRLLTLPRSQRDNPPTHLVRLRSGDYLRGNLESLDAEQVEFRVLGQRKQLPREAVVRVIWLHPEDLDLGAGAEVDEADQDGGTTMPAPVAGLVVQAVSAGGERTTLVADRVEGQSVVGLSPAFGPSRIDTERIDRLLVGKAVAAAEEELPYGQWKLTLAPEPRALREEGP